MSYTPTATFDELLFTDAREFLEVLRLSHPMWGVPKYEHLRWNRRWLFRGHGDGTNWKLIPAAWRTNQFDISVTLQSFRKVYKDQFEYDVKARIGDNFSKIVGFDTELFSEALFHFACEYTLVEEFSIFANEAGLRSVKLPMRRIEDVLNNYISICQNRSIEEFKNFWSEPVFALGQHHGISTRLLDWTRNPLVAAFFAASSNLTDTCITVYAVHEGTLKENNIAIIEVPRADDTYFHAQSAVLTVDCTADYFYSINGYFPSLEETLKPQQNSSSKKISLVSTEVGTLLRLLWLEGVSKAHLMPTLDNVAQALHMKLRHSTAALNQNRKS